MPERATLKKYAQSILRDVWPGAVGALIIYYLVNLIIRWSVGWFNGAFGFLVIIVTTLFVTLPMYLGVSHYFLLVSRKQKATMQDLFSWYKQKRLSKSIAAGIWRGMWYVVWFCIGQIIVFGLLILILPRVFSALGFDELFSSLFNLSRVLLIDQASTVPASLWSMLQTVFYSLSPALITTLIVGFLIGCIPFLIKIIAYSQYEFILCDRPTMSVFRALNMSKIMTDGYKWKIFIWRASFIMWIIATSICALVGFYALPYIRLFYALYYDELKKEVLKSGKLTATDFGDSHFEVLAFPEMPLSN